MAGKAAVKEQVTEPVEEAVDGPVQGIYEGLDQIRAFKKAQEERKAAALANKVNWLKIDKDETVRLWALQELDRGAINYKPECGIGLMATEHTNPENWRIKALCSLTDESPCLGCEKHREDYRAGWGQKSRLYINVLVERKDGSREVAVMSQALGPKSVIGPMILNLAIDENTITNRWFTLTKRGEGKEGTSYEFVPSFKESTDVDPSEYADQLNDLHKAVRAVPYEEQHDFYFRAPVATEKTEESAAPQGRSPWPSDSDPTKEEW